MLEQAPHQRLANEGWHSRQPSDGPHDAFEVHVRSSMCPIDRAKQPPITPPTSSVHPTSDAYGTRDEAAHGLAGVKSESKPLSSPIDQILLSRTGNCCKYQ